MHGGMRGGIFLTELAMEPAATEAALQFTGFDFAVITVVVLSTLIGLLRGFVREVLSLVGWIGSTIITFYCYKEVAQIIRPNVESENVALAAAIGGTFIVSLISFSILNLLIVRLVRATHLGSVDRSLGVAFGAFRGVFLVALAYLMFSTVMSEANEPDTIKNAVTARLVKLSAGILTDSAPSVAEDMQQLGQKVKEDVMGKKGEPAPEAATNPEEKAKSDKQNFLAAILIRPDFAALSDTDRKKLRQIMDDVPPIAVTDKTSPSNLPSQEAANRLINIVRLHKQLEYKKLTTKPDPNNPAPAEPTLPDEPELNQLEEKLIYIFNKTSHTSPATSEGTPAVSAPPPIAGTNE
ncbi:hypothetical protein GC177_03415 [bacterium]|nr:hypothetical protein [bacterium]